MAINFNPRNWHNWISVILVVPIIIVGVTAVFIAHSHELGTKDIDVTRAVNWLPGYGEAAMQAMNTDVRASLLHALEAWGVPVEADCRAGECGACGISVVHGAVRACQTARTSAPPGRTLACCAVPASDLRISL